MNLELLIFIGGILHFGILLASALLPKVLDWKASLGKLDGLSRQLVWVHGVFIVLVIIGFGLLSLVFPSGAGDRCSIGTRNVPLCCTLLGCAVVRTIFCVRRRAVSKKRLPESRVSRADRSLHVPHHRLFPGSLSCRVVSQL